MQITDPKSLLDELDLDRLQAVLGRSSKTFAKRPLTYEEPSGFKKSMNAASVQESNQTSQSSNVDPSSKDEALEPSKTYEIIRGRIHTLGDFIDTDAVRYGAKSPKPPLIIHS
jgi:hypothetical protein